MSVAQEIPAAHGAPRRGRSWPFELWLAAGVALPLCLAPLAGHVDDVDAQTYLVVARNIARSGHWFDLHFLPAVWPHFREHLPFGFWPAAVAIRVAGEGSVPMVYALFTAGAVAAAARLARTVAGEIAAVGAGLSLGLCESIWHYGGRPLLDPPLLLLTTLSCLAWCDGRQRRAAAWAALAVLVKGPHGLLPLLAVGGAEVLLERSPRALGRLLLACAVALVPAFVFLAADRFFGDGSWWRGYLVDQIGASLAGARRDGVTGPLFPLQVIAGRFWPGLPLVAVGALVALRRDAGQRRIALAVLLAIAAISLPTRKWGNHMYVTFPLLSVLAGVGAQGLLARGERFLPRVTLAASAAAVLFAVSGGGRLVLQPPCDFSSALAARLRKVGPRIGLVDADALAIAEIAAEYDLDVRPVPAPEPGMAAAAPLESPVRETFAETARGRSWKLLEPR